MCKLFFILENVKSEPGQAAKNAAYSKQNCQDEGEYLKALVLDCKGNKKNQKRFNDLNHTNDNGHGNKHTGKGEYPACCFKKEDQQDIDKGCCSLVLLCNNRLRLNRLICLLEVLRLLILLLVLLLIRLLGLLGLLISLLGLLRLLVNLLLGLGGPGCRRSLLLIPLLRLLRLYWRYWRLSGSFRLGGTWRARCRRGILWSIDLLRVKILVHNK